MNFSNRDLLMALYCSITILGLLLLGFAWYVWRQSETAAEPFSYWVAAIVLFVVGIVMIIFGVETYIERDDPDVWL